MKTADYIEALKPLAKNPSIYAVAQLLDLREDTVRHYAKGRRAFDPLAATKVAELLDLPPMQVIADAEAERETDEKRQGYWRDLARKLAGLTATGVLITAMLPPGDALASGTRGASGSAGFDNCQIQRQGNINYTRRIWQKVLLFVRRQLRSRAGIDKKLYSKILQTASYSAA